LTIGVGFDDPSGMAAPRKAPADPRKRVVLALTPLTIAVFVAAKLGAGDLAGPHQGKIEMACIGAAFLGLAVTWFAALRAANKHLQS
jgi:hypothetical protein